MEKKILCETLEKLEIGSRLKLKWDRGNGSLEETVRFEGFKKDYPLLYFNGGALLDIDKIGGYGSIISIGRMN